MIQRTRRGAIDRDSGAWGSFCGSGSLCALVVAGALLGCTGEVSSDGTPPGQSIGDDGNLGIGNGRLTCDIVATVVTFAEGIDDVQAQAYLAELGVILSAGREDAGA
jgi:hypothetical protein